MANIMDAEGTVDWIERCSAAVADWASRTMGQKERWDIDGIGEMSELKPGGLNAKQLNQVVCKQGGYTQHRIYQDQRASIRDPAIQECQNKDDQSQIQWGIAL